MKHIYEHIKKSITEYNAYKMHVMHTQTLIMAVVAGIFTVYAVLAPFVIRNIFPQMNNGVVESEFMAMVFACGITLIGFSIIHFCKKIPYRIKSVLYEIFMAFTCLTMGALHPYYSLMETYRQNDYPDYSVFYIVLLVLLIVCVMNPYLFFVCFCVLVTSIVRFMNTVEVYHTKQIYNLVIFCITAIVLYFVNYRSRVNAFLAGEKIVQMQKRREDFMVRLTHEMRTPLNAVLGKNQMILADTQEERTRTLSKQINSSGRMLLSLINDILDQSKLEAGKMNIVVSEYRLDHLIEEIGSIIDSMAEEHSLEFEKIISKQVPGFLNGDEIRIKQIILNLLTNAIKYTPAGKVTLKVDFEFLNDSEGLLKVYVEDTGIGIKPEDISKLSESFVRVDEEKNKGVQGTGLGLSITAGLLGMMGGELLIESQYGSGSVFGFEIKQGYIDKTIDESEDKLQKINSYPDAKVLIVDDNKVNISVVKSLLEKNDITAEAVRSGEQCLAIVAKKKFDIIFLDHMMPNMDGIETLNRLKSDYKDNIKDTKIIALTANYESNAQATYEAYGFNSYLAKPVEIKLLNELLNKYLG